MKKRSLFFLLFAFTIVHAQQTSISPIVAYNLKYNNDVLKAKQLAKTWQIDLRQVNNLGQVLEFSGFNARGGMQFNITDNVGAGRTTSTNKVWPGGTIGTSLTGLNMPNRLGVWDGGAVRTTHQEFAGRVTQVDGATNIIDHATHVSGTMIATGISANAKGMAYQATLKAHDWNDNVSEMDAASAAGMLVSNHSYGTISGWYWDGSQYVWWGDTTVSRVEDYKFGYYDYTSQAWDALVVQYPYHLIIKSAGNDRGDSYTGTTWKYFNGSSTVSVTGTPPGADGQYDCISTYSGAKNVLTVGAVNKIGGNTGNGWTKTSDVVMSSFSGWGPMDDGRIKPDVVGCGVSVYSAVSDSNKAYASMNGTSMASPNVSGSLLLVQQQYFSLKNKYMFAATLKGLTIHTADEAGNAGPDYSYGWGLVNTAKAVQLVSDSVTNQILERNLANTKTFTTGISSAGITPLKVTICWTDPAGNPIAPSLDAPNKMLVNDLDIRLTRLSDGTIFYPYILVKDTPSALARTGDNKIDNVEQIYLATPTAGNYTLTVSHKGSLSGGSQNYSLVISGLMGLPSAILQSNTRSVCTGSQVTYTDNSSGTPTTRKWYFPGGSPATSTAASPVVAYSTAGNFPVALVVSNGLGSDSIYRVNYITAGGLTLPFNETFESNSASLSSWTINNPNSDTTWRLTAVAGTTPGNTAYCLPFFNYSQTGRRDGLITPALSFKGYSAVNMTFQHAYAIDSTASARDSLTIWVSTNCGSTWTELASKAENTTGTNNFKTAAATLNEFYPDAASKWCFGPSGNCITVNLNAYAGSNNIKLKLEGYNNYNNNLYIDNVSVSGTPLLPKANFYVSKKTLCVGDAINFYDSTTNIATAWEWTFNGASVNNSTLQNPSGIVFNTPGTYNVKLKVTNASGADSITKVAYLTVVANPSKPHLTVSGKSQLCTGDSTLLVCDSTASSYQWRLNGNKIGGGTTQQLKVFNGGTYKVDVINTSGCATSSDTMRITLNEYPAQPVVTSNLTSGFMCTGGTATLTSSATAGNQWYKNGSAVTGSTSVNYSTGDSGQYNVQVTLAGCASLMSADKRIDLLPLPGTSSIVGPDTSKKLRTDAFSVTSTPGSSYTWTITGGVKISGGTSATIQVQWNTVGVGVVKVQETANNGCKGLVQTLNVDVVDNVGIGETELISHLLLYPNPAANQSTLSFRAAINGSIEYHVLDITGKTLHIHQMPISIGLNEIMINTSLLSNGIYLVELQVSDMKMVRQLLINK